MCFALAVFVLFVVQIATSQADYMDYHFQVHCDAVNNRAEIVPYAVWNANVYSVAPQDCTLANGRTVRAKMGLGPVYPYGMGGADPSKWLSVWVDTAHVLSRTHFGCEDEGPCPLRIVVSTKGLEVCRRGDASHLSPPNSSRNLAEHCAFTPNQQLSSARDVLEFPSPNETSRPTVGSLATLFATDTQFCSQFQLLSQPRGRPGDNLWPRVGLPDGAETVEADASSSYEYAGRYQYYTFDINNDGQSDTVVGLHARSHYRDGDIYFVYAGNPVPKSVVENVGATRRELPYAKAATRILPHYWSDYAGADEQQLADKDKDDGAYAVKSVTTPWWDRNDTPIFYFRYWYLWPFRYKESTYFLTWSQEGNKQHWYTVLRPEPKYQVTEMCVFQVVQVRY
jgi:hypothetical protein